MQALPVTGKDAVELYAAPDQTSSPRVIHAVRADKKAGPYSLTCVPHDRIKGQEHFSISSTRVCYIAPDHATSFVPTGTWLREHSLFDLLAAKRISKTWLLVKMFRIWSHFTRRSHFAKMQQSFAAQSFLAKPLFCKAILQLRNITHDMTRVQLLDVQPGKAHRLEEFGKNQAETQKVLVQPALELAVSSSASTLLQLITKITEQEALVRRQVEAYEADPSAGASKGHSSIQIRRDWKAKERQLQSLAMDVSKLPSVVRLADMMLCGQAVNMLVEGMTALQACLHAQSPLLVQAAFTESALDFQPNHQVMLKCLNEDVLSPMVACIRKMPRLMASEALTNMWPGKAPAGTDLASSIISNATLNSCRLQCNQAIAKSCQQLQSQASTLEQLQMIHSFSKQFNAEAYTHKQRSMKQLRQDMVLLRQWSIELKQLPEQQQVGVVTLSTADLQHQLSLAVATALEALMAHLVQAACHRCQAVLAECHHLTKLLKERHTRLADFAAWYSTLQKVQAQQQHFQQQQDIAVVMWDMFLSFGGKAMQDQADRFDEMKEDAATFSKATSDAVRFLEERKPGMIALLDRTVKEANNHIKELVNVVEAGKGLGPEQIPVEALAELSNLSAQTESLADQASKLQSYQQQFGVQQTDIRVPPEISQQLALQRSRWQCLKDVADLSDAWMEAKWADFDAAKARQQLNNVMSRIAAVCSGAASEADALLQRLQDDGAAVQKLLKLMLCLTAPHTDRDARWQAACRFMGSLPPANASDYSLQMLSAAGFSAVQYHEQIQSIMAGNAAPAPLAAVSWGDDAQDMSKTVEDDAW